MSPAGACLRAVAASLLLESVRPQWPGLPGSTLNVTEVVWQPEATQVYLGSPSVIRVPGSNAVLCTHDYFGTGAAPPNYPQSVAVARSAPAAGGAFAPLGTASGMYWATLFARPGDSSVYLMGVSNDGAAAGVSITRSTDGGANWVPNPAAILAPGSGGAAFSTGPTPVLAHAGRLWRALERNRGPWASGYAAVVFSAAADVPDLTAAGAWTASGELPFASVAHLVPASAWTNVSGGYTISNPVFGWLEGNAVEPEDASDPGVYVLLRVSAGPTAGVAALLYVANATATPQFRSWVDFPGGQTKFTVRRDATTGVYLTLANALPADANRASLPPACAPVPPPAGALPCCGFLGGCTETRNTTASCLWCHAVARNRLSLCAAPRAAGPWTCAPAPLLADDTGVPSYVSEVFTGFQYADWQFDGDGGVDLLANVRAGYRGSNNYHNSNRHLLLRVPNWRSLVPKATIDAAVAARAVGGR